MKDAPMGKEGGEQEREVEEANEVIQDAGNRRD